MMALSKFVLITLNVFAFAVVWTKGSSLPGSILHFHRPQSPVLGLSFRYEPVGVNTKRQIFPRDVNQTAPPFEGNTIQGGSLPFGPALELSFEAFGRYVVESVTVFLVCVLD